MWQIQEVCVQKWGKALEMDKDRARAAGSHLMTYNRSCLTQERLTNLQITGVACF